MNRAVFTLAIGISILLAACTQAAVNLNRAKGIRGPNAPVISPAGVKFSIQAPEASLVTIIGNFNGWNAQATPLDKGNDGTWSVLLPLKAGHKYYYKYLVDGYSIADPDNPEFETTGSGSVNSIISVK